MDTLSSVLNNSPLCRGETGSQMLLTYFSVLNLEDIQISLPPEQDVG